MNIKKNIGNKIAVKKSGILLYGFVFLFACVVVFKILKINITSFEMTHMFTSLIVLNIALLLTVGYFLLITIKNFSGFYSIPTLFQKTVTTVYDHIFSTVSVEVQEPEINKDKKSGLRNTFSNFNIPGLSQSFSDKEEHRIQNTTPETIAVLSYFATSLFEKNKLEDVLWDIVENCISQLQLEDCVIYMLDTEKKMLIQKAAFGHKNNGERKVISPIQIPLGKGIVGRVAQTGRFEYISDVTNDAEYIIDDANRMSELSIPIFVDDEVVGVLDSEHSQKDFFTENHIFLFQLIARLTENKLKQLQTKNACHITDDNVYFKELEFLMKEAKIYRDANLGLDSMSTQLNISGNYLSQLVNKVTGRNFTDYVNGFRIEDAKSKLRNPEFTNYTIIAIALESGFNSKSTFYSAFKKLTGISPKEYRKIP
ncbi:helix-turn-helix domain-containing protein [Aquimarina algiphila]|uniref:Helix-turn-helix domain-containing protein n=1 Tax=Aquimarina algiphila TaxID=2047982 RepID=A0A554VMB6_9FLAO|nr:helix-turn-helix domain-containing protein [Aquimarina algiphila]TSE09357.1 helix-turn-helix domain-containing protein [Aquimarina algiphila]